MATITKRGLQPAASGSEVVAVSVDATSSAGTAVHEGPSNTDHFDEVWIWATNINTSTETLTIQWGGTTAALHNFVTTINPNETVLVVPGWVLKGTATELLVKAFSTTTDKVNLTGYVNRIDQS